MKYDKNSLSLSMHTVFIIWFERVSRER